MSPPTDDVALSAVSEGRVEVGNNVESPGQGESNATHPPADGGKDAWLFLAACTVVEALVWGTSLSEFLAFILL